MTMRNFSTTFNRIHLKVITFQILFSCRLEIYRVETSEPLNPDWFKSEITWPLQMINCVMFSTEKKMI